MLSARKWGGLQVALLLLSGAVLGPVGCATESCESQPALDMVLAASDQVNADDEGRALATVVRIYQLKSASKLERADFNDIWLHASDTLGSDLVRVDEITLFPKDHVVRPLELEKDTAFVAAVALFRKPSGSSWRTISEVPAIKCSSRGKPIHIQRKLYLENYRIEAAPKAPGNS